MYAAELMTSGLFLQNCLFSITDVKISFTKLEVIFGILIENNYIYMCNYILLYGKGFIYIRNKEQKDLFPLAFLCWLKNKLMLEKEVMPNLGECKKFENIFGLIYNAL